MNLPNYDFSALSSPQLAKRPLSIQTVLTAGSVALVLGFSLLFLNDSLLGSETLMVLVAVTALVGVLLAFYRIYRYGQLQNEALREFAVANNIVYETSLDPTLNGFMFHEGNEREITARLVIPTDGHPIEIGNYQYTTGSGKNKTTHDLGYMRLKLPRRVPHMVLDATANNFMGRFSNLPALFDKQQVLELEGDFNEYFTLYTPEKYERDALYVFTPDVMQVLVDLAGDYDVELIDDDLFVYSSRPFTLAHADTLQGLLMLASRLSPEFTSQTDRYADERIANFNANVIAEPGQRLKKRFAWVWLVFIGIYFIGTFGDEFASQDLQSSLYMVLGIVFWILVIWLVSRRIRRRR